MLVAEQRGVMAPKYSVVSRYDRATSENCVFTTTRMNAAEFANAPVWTDFAGTTYNNNNDPSLDHACSWFSVPTRRRLTYTADEKQWLSRFFNHVVSSQNAAGALTCAQMKQFLFPTQCQTLLVQDVFNELGSSDNLRFIAMSVYLNSNAKSMLFPPEGRTFDEKFVHDPSYEMPNSMAGWTWPSNGGVGPPYSAKDALDEMLGYFERVLYGVLEMKSDNLLKLIDQTNNAIYKRL